MMNEQDIILLQFSKQFYTLSFDTENFHRTIYLVFRTNNTFKQGMIKLDMQQQINICKSYIAILYNHDSKITNKCALNVVNSSVSVHENILQTNKCANSSSNLHSISCHFTEG